MAIPTKRERMDFGSQAEWEAYLREQPVPPLRGYFRSKFEEEERAVRRVQAVLARRELPELAKPDPYKAPEQMRLEMRTRDGKVPNHASDDVVKSDYLSNVMSPLGLQKAVRKTINIIRKSGVEFDAIAFRGLSGALVGPAVACRMKKGFLAVRKMKEEESHSTVAVEGAVKADCQYIIIDDLISSGATVWNIVTELNKFQYVEFANSCKAVYYSHKRKCVGVFLYNSWVSDKHKARGYDHSLREVWSSYDHDAASFNLPVWSFSAK